MSVGTLHDLMMAAGVVNHPSWFDKISLRFWPMAHQMEMVHKYARNYRYLDASDPGAGKTYPAQIHSVLLAALGNKVLFTMPPKLIDQFIEEFRLFFGGIDNHLVIDHLNCSAGQKRKKEEEWMRSGWPDILVMSYDVYREYNDKSPMKKIGPNRWYCRKKHADGTLEYMPFFKEDGTPVHEKAQPFTKDGREINKKGMAKNLRQMMLKEAGYEVLFFDEAHALCGMESILSKSVAEMSHRLKDDVAIYLMTGTPVPTKLHDVYGLIRLINPQAYLNKAAFLRQHCVIQEMRIDTGKREVMIPTIIDYFDTEKVYEALWKNAHRVQKRDVIDMPDPLISEVKVHLSKAHKAVYDKVINDRFAILGDKVLAPDNQSAVRHMGLRLISCPGEFDAKLAEQNELAKSTMELVETISPAANRKVVVFAYYKGALRQLQEMFKGYNPAVVYGDSADSKAEIDRFKNDPDCTMLLINWISGGAGLNLQIANYMIFYEIPTSPRDAKQAIARIDRKGQLQLVNIYFMRVMGTLSNRNMKSLLKNEESNNRVIKDKKDLLHELLGAA